MKHPLEGLFEADRRYLKGLAQRLGRTDDPDVKKTDKKKEQPDLPLEDVDDDPS